MVLAAIKGNRLSSFIDPAVQFPDMFNIDRSVNEEFLDWEQQDQILLVWMLSSITQELLPEFVGCQTTCETWKSIEQLFSAQSKANVMQLKLQLQTLKKAGLSMTEYLKKKKSIMDVLAFAGHPLTNDDKLMQILGGLGYDQSFTPQFNGSNGAENSHVTQGQLNAMTTQMAAMTASRNSVVDPA
ncbi:hypothetical protein ACOSQ3_019167 [Xanthoceras sorbifolium]